MRGKWLLASAAVILLAVAAGSLSLWWRERVSKAHTHPEPQPATAPAVVGTDISLPGKIRAQHVTLVPAPVEGAIETFYVDTGEEVFEGQLLAKIGNAGLETAHQRAAAELETAESRLNRLQSGLIAARLEASRASADRTRARGEFERAQKTHLRQQFLHREGATPRLTYEKAEREFTAAQTGFDSRDEVARVADERASSLVKDIDIARNRLEERTRELEDAKGNLAVSEIHSPVDGIVVGRRGQPGDAVNRDLKDLIQIGVDLGLLAIVAEPDPPALAAIRPGQPAIIQIAELGGEGLPGTVAQVAGGKVTVDFTSPSPLLKPGMTANVRIRIR